MVMGLSLTRCWVTVLVFVVPAVAVVEVVDAARQAQRGALVDAAPTVPLGPGIDLPMVVLGTGSGQHGDVAAATALWLGSTAGVGIDTAWSYQDQRHIAEGMRRAGVSRQAVFLETKIPPSSYEDARARITSDLADLGVPFVDLLLIHYPGPEADNAATWCALEAALAANETRAVGVSNFNVSQLEALGNTARVAPAVLQSELSVSYHDDATLAYCAARGIVHQAYSPLCGGFNGSSCTRRGGKNVLTVPEVLAVAAAHPGVSPAQVGLKWIVQRGHPLATAAWDLNYMEEDLNLWSWGDLRPEEMANLDAVYRPTRRGDE